LLAKLKDQGGLQELNQDLVASGDDRPDLMGTLPEQANSSLELPMKILEMDQTIQLLEQRISAVEEKKRA
jgi:hypothetical protein